MELTMTAVTQALGITRAALSTLLNERANLSPEMALRVEKAFGGSMNTPMRMQNSFDFARTRKREGGVRVARYDRAIEGIGSAHDAVV